MEIEKNLGQVISRETKDGVTLIQVGHFVDYILKVILLLSLIFFSFNLFSY